MVWPAANANHLLVTANQMGQLEQQLFDSGLPVAALMEKAGLALAERLKAEAGLRNRGLVALGPQALGDEGGDALLVLDDQPARGAVLEQVVELLGRSDGIGFQLHMAFQVFDVASILAYSLAFIAVVQLIELALLQPLERRASRWRAFALANAASMMARLRITSGALSVPLVCPAKSASLCSALVCKCFWCSACSRTKRC